MEGTEFRRNWTYLGVGVDLTHAHRKITMLLVTYTAYKVIRMHLQDHLQNNFLDGV